ncbi:MAG: hypothetical protein FGM14_15545 [Flavobacteriales bacterium]|nr:hypothetical protein [Flavobacteriales bacterium]
MKKISAHQTLDKILKEIKNSSEVEPINLEETIKDKFEYISKRDRRAIREKLIEDKLVGSFIPFPGASFIEKREYQYITYNGLLFLEKGGYSREKRRQLSKLWLDYILIISIVISGSITSVYYIREMCQNKVNQKEDIKQEKKLLIIKKDEL